MSKYLYSGFFLKKLDTNLFSNKQFKSIYENSTNSKCMAAIYVQVNTSILFGLRRRTGTIVSFSETERVED